MNSSLNISSSGMNAAALRVNVAADNLVNQQDTAPAPKAGRSQPYNGFSAKQVEQTTQMGGGTSATVRAVNPAFVLSFSADSPLADENGNVAKPNVREESQLAGLAQATYTYKADLKAFQTANDLIGAVLDIKKS